MKEYLNGTGKNLMFMADVFPGSTSSLADAEQWANVGNTAFLSAADSTGVMVEPWKTDGTQQGTTLVKDIAPLPTSGSFPAEFETLGDAVLFRATLPESGYELRDTPPLEFYLNDPDRTKPENLKTDIYVPVTSA